MPEPKEQPSNEGKIRRFVMKESQPCSPEEAAARLAEHKASTAATGPDPGTVRLSLRAKLDNESALVRGMYDIANKPKRRSRRRKGSK